MQQSFNMTYEHGKEGASMAFSLIFWGGSSYRPELTLSGHSGTGSRRSDISNINFHYPSSHVCIPIADGEDCCVMLAHAESGITNHINSIRRSFLHTDISVLSGPERGIVSYAYETAGSMLSGAEKSVLSGLENCIDLSGQKTAGSVLSGPEGGIVSSADETAGSVLSGPEGGIVSSADETAGSVLSGPESSIMPYADATVGAVLTAQERTMPSDPERSLSSADETAGYVLSSQENCIDLSGQKTAGSVLSPVNRSGETCRFLRMLHYVQFTLLSINNSYYGM